jgi:hypothetical protein
MLMRKAHASSHYARLGPDRLIGHLRAHAVKHRPS